LTDATGRVRKCVSDPTYSIRLPETRLPSMKKYMCLICGWIYDEAVGSPEDGIAPGTRWDDVPPNWTCPECGARKDDFEMVEF
jgi:rubredoxin